MGHIVLPMFRLVAYTADLNETLCGQAEHDAGNTRRATPSLFLTDCQCKTAS